MIVFLYSISAVGAQTGDPQNPLSRCSEKPYLNISKIKLKSVFVFRNYNKLKRKML